MDPGVNGDIRRFDYGRLWITGGQHLFRPSQQHVQLSVDGKMRFLRKGTNLGNSSEGLD